MTTNLDLNPRANLTDLVARLEDYGVEVPGLVRWRELHALVRTEPPAPALPENLLEQTVEQLGAWAEKYALHYVTTTSQAQRRADPYHYATKQITQGLDPALKAQIRDNAVSIIDQLRPEFDEAVGMLRYARDLGVRPSDTVESLFHASDEKRNAWTAAKQAAPVLDGIFETRQMLSTVADVAPTLDFEIGRHRRRDVLELGQPSGVNWTVTIVNPEVVGTVSLEPMNYDAPWQRWLAIAPQLQLARPIEEKRDAAYFLKTTGMTIEQAVATSKAEGESANALASTVSPAR